MQNIAQRWNAMHSGRLGRALHTDWSRRGSLSEGRKQEKSQGEAREAAREGGSDEREDRIESRKEGKTESEQSHCTTSGRGISVMECFYSSS